MLNSDNATPEQAKELSHEELIEAYKKLYSDNRRTKTTNKHVLSSVDRMTLNGEQRLETGMTIMAGVMLKKTKRRTVTVQAHDFESFMKTNTVKMTADKEDNITYTLEGDFNA